MVNYTPPDPNKPLTAMQARFVDEYVLDPSNATAAAKRAGFSLKSAKDQALQMLKKPHIASRIDEANEQVAERIGITKERILQELAIIALSNVDNVITTDKDGNVDVSVSPNGPVSEVSYTSVKGKNKEIKVKYSTADKRQALIDIAKMLGWHKEKVELTGTLSLEQLIEASMGEPTESDATER